jgi:cell division protein FtsZ
MSKINPGAVSIKVIGIGGTGCNAITRMVRQEVRGVEFIAMDTDTRLLEITPAPIRIPLGKGLTFGKGTNGNHIAGKWCAEESLNEIKQVIAGADMVCLVAGLGGGTGTGAMPVVADIARQSGALTVGIVTKPFSFEGKLRARVAEEGFKQLVNEVNTLIDVDISRLLGFLDNSADGSYETIDKFLSRPVQTIASSVNLPGLKNIGFTGIKTVLNDMRLSVISSGYASGNCRAENAAKSALDDNQFEKYLLKNVKRAILGISGNTNLTLSEAEEAAGIIKRALHPDAIVTFGAFVDPKSKDEICVTLICGGGIEMKAPPIENERDSTSQNVDPGARVGLKEDDAKEISDLSAAIASGDDSAYSCRGLAYQENGEFDKAVADFTKYIEKYPDVVSTYWDRGEVYIRSKEYDKAIADYDKAVEIDPNNDVCYRARGVAYLEMGESEKAISDLNRAIELRPSYDNIFERGQAYYRLGDYDKALEYCTRAIELDPTNYTGFSGRGFAWAGQSQYEKAISDYTTAITKGDKFIYLARAIAYCKLGEIQKAVADYTEFLKLSDGSEFFDQVKQDMDRLRLEMEVVKLPPDGVSLEETTHQPEEHLDQTKGEVKGVEDLLNQLREEDEIIEADTQQDIEKTIKDSGTADILKKIVEQIEQRRKGDTMEDIDRTVDEPITKERNRRKIISPDGNTTITVQSIDNIDHICIQESSGECRLIADPNGTILRIITERRWHEGWTVE